MQSGKSEWQGCVTPIPKDVRAGFEKARGEFCAYPIGCGARSRRRRAGLIWQTVSDAGPRRLCKTEGRSWAYTAREPYRGVECSCRSFLLVLLRREVASTAGCQLGLGIGSLLAIVGPGRSGDGSRVAGENGTCTPFGSGPASSPGSQAGVTRHGASRWAGTQQGG